MIVAKITNNVILSKAAYQCIVQSVAQKHHATTAKAKTEYIPPIINKQELDSVQPDDPRHFKQVTPASTHESNSINYEPRLQ
jgi:hypothetical protein